MGDSRFDVVAVERSGISIAIETNGYDAAVEPAFDDRSDLACEPRAALSTKRAQFKTIAGLRFLLGVGQETRLPQSIVWIHCRAIRSFQSPWFAARNVNPGSGHGGAVRSPRSHRAYFSAVQAASCRQWSKSSGVRLGRYSAQAARKATRASS